MAISARAPAAVAFYSCVLLWVLSTLTSVLRRGTTGSEQQRRAVSASVSSWAARAGRGDRADTDRWGAGFGQPTGGLARGGEDHRRVAALPLPHHHTDRGQAAPADRHVGEERQAPPGRGVRPSLAGVALCDQGVV